MARSWHVPLVGGPTDIADMRNDLRTGELRVEDVGGKPCLCGGPLDACSSSEEAYRTGKRLVGTLNDAFAAAVARFEPVRLDGVLQVLPDGTVRRHQYLEVSTLRAEVRLHGPLLRIGSAPSPKPEPTLAERMMKATDADEFFRAALRAFSTDPTTFPSLFVALETIKQGGGEGKPARKTGGERMVAEGWATEAELRDFAATAHLHRHGQPPGPIDKGCREITLEEGRELVRRLLSRWAQELAP